MSSTYDIIDKMPSIDSNIENHTQRQFNTNNTKQTSEGDSQWQNWIWKRIL